jgi:hypothetical protein
MDQTRWITTPAAVIRNEHWNSTYYPQTPRVRIGDCPRG